MDKVDVALIISIGSFLAAGASAFYARRLAIQDAKKMARKHPILEIGISRPLKRFIGGKEVLLPDVLVTDVIIRNIEPHAQLRLLQLRSLRGASLAKREDIATKDRGGLAPTILDPIPASAFKSTYNLGYALRVFGTPRHQSGQSGDTDLLVVYSTRPLTPKDIILDWEWMDGQKK